MFLPQAVEQSRMKFAVCVGLKEIYEDDDWDDGWGLFASHIPKGC